MAWSILIEPISEGELRPKAGPSVRAIPSWKHPYGKKGGYQDTQTGEVYLTSWQPIAPASHGRAHGQLVFETGPWRGVPVPGVAPAKIGKKDWVTKLLEPAVSMVIGWTIGYGVGKASAWLTREALWNLGAGSITGNLGTMSLGATQLIAGYTLPALASYGTSYLPGGTYTGIVTGWGATVGYWTGQVQAVAAPFKKLGHALEDALPGQRPFDATWLFSAPASPEAYWGAAAGRVRARRAFTWAEWWKH